MDLEIAEKIVDDLFQKKAHARDIVTPTGVIIDISKDIGLTDFEEAAIMLLNVELSYKRKIEQLEKENEELKGLLGGMKMYELPELENMKNLFDELYDEWRDLKNK